MMSCHPPKLLPGMLAVMLLAGITLLPATAGAAEETTVDPAAAVTEPPATRQMDTIELSASVSKVESYPVDLPSILKLVEDQNLSIAEREKNTEILQNRYRQRQAALLPNIDATYNQSRLEGGQQVFGDVVSIVRQTVQPQLSASWTLYPGGRTIYEMLAAKRRKEASDFQLKETYQEQLARATEDYYRLLAAYMQKDVALQGMTEAQAQVELNQALVRVGRGIPLDLSRAQTTYAQQQSALVQAETAIIQAEQVLLNRLNLDSSIHLVPKDMETAKTPLVPTSLAAGELIIRAIAQNPAVKTGEEELKALGYDYKAARSDLIPSVTLRTYVSGTGSQRSELIRSTFTGVSVNMNLLENLGLAVPLRMQERKKLIEQKVLLQKQLVRDIETQVMTAFLNSQNYKSALDAAELELSSAKESYDLAVGRFKAGYGVNLDVVEATTALTTARNNVTQAILNYNQAQVQLVEAIGQISPETLVVGIPTTPPPPATPQASNPSSEAQGNPTDGNPVPNS